jgi:uncharacterized membrane protein
MPPETPKAGAPPGSEPDLGNRFAWQAHEAIQGWTESVDVKTSIVLLVEIAVAGAAVSALVTNGGELHGAVGLHLATAITAIAALSAAVACALWVVFPRLERRRTVELAPKGLLYFGHLQARSVEDIAAALGGLTIEEEHHQLATQLHITAGVAWRKHLWLQRSIVLLALGAALLVVSFVAFG